MTDARGKLDQHVEYSRLVRPGWRKRAAHNGRLIATHTGKELDEEIGLYYFGARYYDPQTSTWPSPDPDLGEYLAGTGMYQSINSAVYTYAALSRLRYIDPDGRQSGSRKRRSSWSNGYQDYQDHRDVKVDHRRLAVEGRDAVAAKYKKRYDDAKKAGVPNSKNRPPPATVSGAYSPSKGRAVVGASRGGGRGCTEDDCYEKTWESVGHRAHASRPAANQGCGTHLQELRDEVWQGGVPGSGHPLRE